MTWTVFLHWMKNIAVFLGASITILALVGLMIYDAIGKIGDKEYAAKISSKMEALGIPQPVSFSGNNATQNIDCEAIRRCLGMQPATCPSNLKATPGHTFAGEGNNKPIDGNGNGQTPAPFTRPPLAKGPDWLEAARRKSAITHSTPAMATPFVQPGQGRNLPGPDSFQDSSHDTPEKNPVIGVSRNKPTDDTSSFPSLPMSPWGQNSQPNVPTEATDDREDRSGGREAESAPSGVLDALVNSRSPRCQN